MKYLTIGLWLAVSQALCISETQAHGTPINSKVLTDSGQLAVINGYGHGVLESFGGSDIFTDAPAIGISSTFNGFQPDDLLFLNVVQGLLFWDGAAVAPATETLAIDWPDEGGISNVETYHVTAQSNYQTGMLWGKYRPTDPVGNWDAHGDYTLGAVNPAVGVYGLVLQLTAPGYIASEPFLLPLVYDPYFNLGAVKVTEGITELQQAVLPLPSADFDRDTKVDATDLAIWLAGFGILSDTFQVEGDATGDGAITGEDFLAWQRQSSGVSASFTVSFNSVPEPATLFLAITISFAHLTFCSPRNF